jgi:hypothetical protein
LHNAKRNSHAKIFLESFPRPEKAAIQKTQEVQAEPEGF